MDLFLCSKVGGRKLEKQGALGREEADFKGGGERGWRRGLKKRGVKHSSSCEIWWCKVFVFCRDSRVGWDGMGMGVMGE